MRRTCVLAGFAALLALAGLPAQALEAPKGPVILIVDGAIAISNEAGGRALFDREMLERMGTTTVVTTTPWTEGVPKFEGVLLRRVLEAVGAKGETLRMVAINDYAVEIPAANAKEYGVVLAYRMNGEQLTVRSKGPLWVIYPWSDHGEIQNEIYHARSIWQLKQITSK